MSEKHIAEIGRLGALVAELQRENAKLRAASPRVGESRAEWIDRNVKGAPGIVQAMKNIAGEDGDDVSNVERPNLSPESLIEWASSWVPEADRARFAEALASELRAGSAPKMDLQARVVKLETALRKIIDETNRESVYDIVYTALDNAPKVPQHGEKT